MHPFWIVIVGIPSPLITWLSDIATEHFAKTLEHAEGVYYALNNLWLIFL